jgi:hypothetical protein
MIKTSLIMTALLILGIGIGIVIGMSGGGQNLGNLEAKNEITNILIKEFPSKMTKDDYAQASHLYDFKCVGVYAVLVNGVRTIKIAD